jgi:tol-pal system protein YbgF
VARVIFLFAVMSLLSGCITTGEYLALKNDVNQLKRDYYSHDRDIALIKKDFGVVQDTSKKSVGLESFDAIRESQEQINSRLTTLSREVQELRGKFDEYKYSSDRSDEKKEAELENVRSRLEKIEIGIAAAGVSAGIKATKEEEVKEKVKTPEVTDPKDLYEAAHKHFKKGEYESAREVFNVLLKKYPKHELADNSQFWIAESFYREKDSENAIIEYQKLIKRYPKSAKIPSALYKQALSFEAIKDHKNAKVVLQLLVKKYPDSAEAKKAKAKLKKSSKKKK